MQAHTYKAALYVQYYTETRMSLASGHVLFSEEIWSANGTQLNPVPSSSIYGSGLGKYMKILKGRDTKFGLFERRLEKYQELC